MKTAGLIKLSTARNAKSLIDYDTQARKTSGGWRDENGYRQSDLVTFHGVSNVPGTVKDKSRAFVRNANDNANVHLIGAPNNQVRNQTTTVVQSFDFRANSGLTPTQAHLMGEQFYGRLKAYFKSNYHYDLAGGVISTHIDDEQERAIPKRYHTKYHVRKPHLHNHIALPYFNAKGQAIYPYLRRRDIYALQNINDGVVRDNGLNDYYFAKLERKRQPMSTYTLKRQHNNPARRSNVGIAWHDFKEANDFAWDYAKGDYRKAKPVRDEYLRYKYGYQAKEKTDRATGKKRTVFTLNNMKLDRNLNQRWYSLLNMQALRWRDKKEARAERLLWEFSFKKLTSRAVSYDNYQKTVRYAGRNLPDVSRIVSGGLRRRFKVDMYGCYRHVEKTYSHAKRSVRTKVADPLQQKLNASYEKCRQLARGYRAKLTDRRPRTDANGDHVLSRVPALAEQGRKREQAVRQKRATQQPTSYRTERARPQQRASTKHDRSNGISLE